jgi:Tfp pilus assembly protein PilZ
MADEVHSKLVEGLSGGSAAIVLVGDVPGRAEARHLADLGFRWLVRRPFTHEELHLGASAALGAGNWSDGRKSPRVPVDMKVDVARPGSIDHALVCDLSAGGMFLAMANPPELDASLIIEMELGARTMLLRGVVAHCSHRASPDRSHGVGVRFDDLEPSDSRTIADYVEARLGSVRL